MAKQEFFDLDTGANEFLSRCSEDNGRFHADSFNSHVWSILQDKNVTSPIEQYLFIALHATFISNLLDEIACIVIHGEQFFSGYHIAPQHTIDQYRCDFMVSYIHDWTSLKDVDLPGAQRKVLVECDSQQWHERTENERRYEKARDRHFAKSGYHAFHFTGTEILADPFMAASEVVAFVTSHDKQSIYEAVRADQIH